MENNTHEIYHSDHLGSSTYLTDNFGRPSHYYETLPFGEMIVEHNQSSFYDNAFKFNGKELDEATQMYYYGARYYDPRISIFVSVDPLAEKTMEPYLYTGNNPIMFTDPTGMSAEFIDGPGDEFKTLEEAAIDFGKEYNGLSITSALEIGTNFYEAKNPDGETFYSYTIPVFGGGGMIRIPYNLEEGQNLVATGHTHSNDDVMEWMEKGKMIQISSANRFSEQDIQFFNNALENADGSFSTNMYNKSIQGFIAIPNGGLLHYDPDKSYNEINIKGQYGSTPSYNKPIYEGLPSDPNSRDLRLNNISPNVIPIILPE